MGAERIAVVGVDPGSRLGWAGPHGSGTVNVERRVGTKKRREEPEWARMGHVWGAISRIVYDTIAPDMRVLVVRDGLSALERAPLPPTALVVEGAPGFTRGQAAVAVGHNIRGVAKLWCWRYRTLYFEVSPVELKQYATGRAKADKHEMVAAARARLGYEGADPDEADAIWLRAFGRARADILLERWTALFGPEATEAERKPARPADAAL